MPFMILLKPQSHLWCFCSAAGHTHTTASGLSSESGAVNGAVDGRFALKGCALPLSKYHTYSINFQLFLSSTSQRVDTPTLITPLLSGGFYAAVVGVRSLKMNGASRLDRLEAGGISGALQAERDKQPGPGPSSSAAQQSCFESCAQNLDRPELWNRPDDQVGPAAGAAEPCHPLQRRAACHPLLSRLALPLLALSRRKQPQTCRSNPLSTSTPLRTTQQKKTLPEQWRTIHSRWRFVTALVPYLGPPIHTLNHIFFPVASVVLLCVAIKFADGKIGWELDILNNFSLLFRYSSFVLSLLLAFRLNRTCESLSGAARRAMDAQSGRFEGPQGGRFHPLHLPLSLPPPASTLPQLSAAAPAADDRWWQARCAFGGIGGGVGNVVRQVATWTDDPVLIK
jgi:hypothetical protein